MGEAAHPTAQQLFLLEAVLKKVVPKKEVLGKEVSVLKER